MNRWDIGCGDGGIYIEKESWGDYCLHSDVEADLKNIKNLLKDPRFDDMKPENIIEGVCRYIDDLLTPRGEHK